MKKTLLGTFAAALMVCGAACGEVAPPTAGFIDSTLDTFGITVAPSPAVLGEILGHP